MRRAYTSLNSYHVNDVQPFLEHTLRPSVQLYHSLFRAPSAAQPYLYDPEFPSQKYQNFDSEGPVAIRHCEIGCSSCACSLN